MKIPFFGDRELNISFGSKIEKSNDIQGLDKNFINYMGNLGFSFTGNSLSSCGQVTINQNTMYEIHQSNKMAFAYSNKISQMVSGGGIGMVDEEGNIIDNTQTKKDIEQLYDFIGGKENYQIFTDDFFDQAFAAGQVFSVPSSVNGMGLVHDNGEAVILDSRGITIKTDKFGRKKEYNYRTFGGTEDYSEEEIVDYMVYRNLDIKYLGRSIYSSIVYDAITNNEASRTQMYYFKNDAKPNMIIMLNTDAFKGVNGPENKKEFDKQWEDKYGGSDKSGKPQSSHLINDIKTLDISNVDLDLINLRDSNNESFSIVFMLDARLIGIHKKTGSRGEIESLTIRQGNEQMAAYARIYSGFLNDIYKRFVNPNVKGRFVAINKQFQDLVKDKEIALKEVEGGVASGGEYREQFGFEERDDEILNVIERNKSSTNDSSSDNPSGK